MIITTAIAHQLPPAVRPFAPDMGKCARVLRDVVIAANRNGHQLDIDVCACGSRVADAKLFGFDIVVCIDTLAPIHEG